MSSTNTLLASFLVLSCASVASAQGGHGGVASSGMGQGEARITSRSDVMLSMESMPGTNGAAVSALGTRVGARMAQIRGCYERTVAERPTVTGTLRLRVLLEGRGRPTIEIDGDRVNDRELVTCMTDELARIDHSGLRRPTRAVVQLVLGNTAAAGAGRAAERAQEIRQVAIQIDGDGNATTSGGTPDGRVQFTVTGRGRDSAPAVTSAYRAMNTTLAGLMDCRRRASRRGASPAGALSVTMTVRDGRAPTSRVTRSTVANEQARGCVGRVLSRIEERASGGRGPVRVEVRFGEADTVDAHD
jgi:hypothetical protein